MKKEVYLFPNLNKKQYLFSWIIIIPLYFYVIKNCWIMPLAKVFSVDITTECFMSVAALIRNIIIMTIIVIIFQQYIRESFVELRKYSFKHTMGWIGRGAVYFLCVCVVNGVVHVIVNQISAGSLVIQAPQNQMVVDVFLATNLALAVLSDVIIAPIVEEFVFRVIIFHTLRKLHAVVAIVGTSLLFGGLHVYQEIFNGDPVALIYMVTYAGTAFALAILYEKRKNILICIALHMIINLISLLP